MLSFSALFFQAGQGHHEAFLSDRTLENHGVVVELALTAQGLR